MDTLESSRIAEHVAHVHRHQVEISRAMLATARHLACLQAAVVPDTFAAIVAKQFGWSPAAAEQLLAVGDAFGANEHAEQIQAGALLLLARRDIAPAISQAAVARARVGFVNAATVRSMLKAHAAGEDVTTISGRAKPDRGRRHRAAVMNGHSHANGDRIARQQQDDLAIAELVFVDEAQGLQIVNALEQHLGVLHVRQLLRKTRFELLPLPNFGSKKLRILADAMRKAGFAEWADDLAGHSNYST